MVCPRFVLGAIAGAVSAGVVLGGSAALGQVGDLLREGRAVVVGSNGTGRENACMQCHGGDGAGDAVALFPRLAGQLPAYMVKTLDDYASSRRENEIMGPIARALSDGARRAVSIYYAAQSAPSGDVEAEFMTPERIERGGVLSAVGDSSIGVQGCQNCHGPDGRGLAPSYPALAGQHAGYLKQTLRDWKTGARDGDPQNIMRHIARKLDDEDIEAVAAYFATLPPPGPTVFSDPVDWAAAFGAASSGGGPR